MKRSQVWGAVITASGLLVAIITLLVGPAISDALTKPSQEETIR
jgi:hypothetical protein